MTARPGRAAPFERMLDGLHALSRALGERGVSAESCSVGPAVIHLVFDAAPTSRNVRYLFGPTQLLAERADEVGASLGLPPAWLDAATLDVTAGEGGADGWLDLEHLRVFEAPPQYLLAMKCASLSGEPGYRDTGDLRFLLRCLNLTGREAALAEVRQYFTERQLPDDLPDVLDSIFSG